MPKVRKEDTRLARALRDLRKKDESERRSLALTTAGVSTLVITLVWGVVAVPRYITPTAENQSAATATAPLSEIRADMGELSRDIGTSVGSLRAFFSGDAEAIDELPDFEVVDGRLQTIEESQATQSDVPQSGVETGQSTGSETTAPPPQGQGSNVPDRSGGEATPADFEEFDTDSQTETDGEEDENFTNDATI